METVEINPVTIDIKTVGVYTEDVDNSLGGTVVYIGFPEQNNREIIISCPLLLFTHLNHYFFEFLDEKMYYFQKIPGVNYDKVPEDAFLTLQGKLRVPAEFIVIKMELRHIDVSKIGLIKKSTAVRRPFILFKDIERFRLEEYSFVTLLEADKREADKREARLHSESRRGGKKKRSKKRSKRRSRKRLP